MPPGLQLYSIVATDPQEPEGRRVAAVCDTQRPDVIEAVERALRELGLRTEVRHVPGHDEVTP